MQRGLNYNLYNTTVRPPVIKTDLSCLNNASVAQRLCSHGMILCCVLVKLVHKHPVWFQLSPTDASIQQTAFCAKKVQWRTPRMFLLRLTAHGDGRAALSSSCPCWSSGQVPSGNICPWPRRSELCTALEKPQWASALETTHHNMFSCVPHFKNDSKIIRPIRALHLIHCYLGGNTSLITFMTALLWNMIINLFEWEMSKYFLFLKGLISLLCSSNFNVDN